MDIFRKERDKFRSMGGRFEIAYPVVNIFYGERIIKCIAIDGATKYRISDCIDTAIGMIDAIECK